ncbi:cell division cycle-associated protein 3 [Mugil cephalus]|uniref:cell division cycle-associated protein 3 n=1 Tax=Mugil cephalus TaxID=48193 RepID=UPI001FB6CE22|nr:cell division cycle-associated protein 3 [Mugil cephalus]
MGSSESKMSASTALKPEPVINKTQVSHLIDPRSPSTGIDRTPIQVDGFVSKTSAKVKSECPLAFGDPRSPTIGITRTPVREVMRATVGSLARRLGMLFHNEAEGKSLEGAKNFSDAVEEEVLRDEELASAESLQAPLLPYNVDSLAEHANLLATPVQLPVQSTGDSSPFVLLEEPQVEIECEDISLEEAEEARESPLHKRLSTSLITYHEGATASYIFTDVHGDGATSPEPSVESLKNDGDHSYAVPSITVKSPVEPSLTADVDNSPVQPEEAEKPPQDAKESPSLPPVSSEAPSVPSPQQPQVSTGIRCPTFDSKSPSQAVFKPQWLSKGFGATGVRARGVQGHSGKGGASPLAVRVAVKNIANENKGQSGKLKQKGSEGRSPLQILKETNSPREHRSQMKPKVSTPDRQRLGQMDRRVLAVSVDKENR